MAKGAPIVTFRCPPALLRRLAAYIEKSADTRIVHGQWERSAFILAAIEEKLSRIERSAKKRRKKVNPEPAKAD